MEGLTIHTVFEYYYIGVLYGFFTGSVVMLIGIVIKFIFRLFKK